MIDSLLWFGGAISYNLKSHLVIFPNGRIAANLYKELVLEKTLPRFYNICCIYSDLGSPPFQVVEDNAPIHSAKLC